LADVPSEREQLIEARNRLQEQLESALYPVRPQDRSRSLIAKLRRLIAEIDACLAEMDKNDV
jgi:hypothetical protein